MGIVTTPPNSTLSPQAAAQFAPTHWTVVNHGGWRYNAQPRRSGKALPDLLAAD